MIGCLISAFKCVTVCEDTDPACVLNIVLVSMMCAFLLGYKFAYLCTKYLA